MSQTLYDLPEGWDIKALTDVVEFIGGSQPPKSEFSEICLDGYVRLIQIRDYKSDDYIVYVSEKSTKKFCNDDDVMIGRYGPPVFQILRGLSGAYNVALMKAEPDQRYLTKDYLYWFLRSSPIQNYVISISQRAAGQSGVNKQALEKYEIPLPPLAEQTRIVEKLDAVLSRIDTAIDELQQSLALVDAMFKSGLDKAFNRLGSPTNETGLYDLPDGWGWHLVKDISQNIQYGHTAKATDSGSAGFLRITDIQDGMINWSGVPFVEVSEKELAKYELQKNDLVFARSGATAGKSILIDEPPKNMIFASYLIRIIPNQLIVFPKYLALFFQSPMYWSIVMQNASGAAQPNINGTKLGEFSVPLPNLAEQQQVVEALDALNDKTTQLKTELTAKIGMFNQLKASVLDGAFRGEL